MITNHLDKKGWCLNGVPLTTETTIPLNPSQSISLLDFVINISTNVYDSMTNPLNSYDMHSNLLKQISAVINDNYPDYLEEGFGLVYIQDLNLSSSAFLAGVGNPQAFYTLSANVAFFKNNNNPATSPSGV